MFLITFSDFHRFDLILSPPIAQINGKWDDREKSNTGLRYHFVNVTDYSIQKI